MTKRVVNLVIAGCGRAAAQHVEALNCVPGIRLSGAFDLEGRRLGSVKQYDTFREVLSDPNVDAISFCCPPGTRYVDVRAALEARKSVVVEKPPALSHNEHRALCHLASQYSVHIHCMLQHRHRVPSQTLGSSMGSALGVLLSSRYRPISAFTDGWRGDAETSLGGIVSHLGIHYLDIAVEWLGVPKTFNLSDASIVRPGIERSLTGHIMFEAGQNLQLGITGSIEARCEALHVVDASRSLQLVDGRFTTNQVTGTDFIDVDDVTQLRAAVYKDFLRSCREDDFLTARCALHRTERIQRAMDLIRRAIVSTLDGAFA
ncbi:Gfo/Idh/MocA family protein [Rhizobium brockwellii]|jgi:predicted dehydrogenase|uniref:Gfo/Idh/MocA family protein n=1 Tax=Rhizobium brockwellii TaxID=3019932 RepID=UPI003F9C01F7